MPLSLAHPRYEVGYKVGDEWVMELDTNALLLAYNHLRELREWYPKAYIWDNQMKRVVPDA